jgi:hypothetical protein
LEDRTVPATFTVLNTLDNGADSLRQAIINSNASSDPSNTILFALIGSGVHTINLQSALPEVTNPVLIDGYSQAGSSANTLAQGDNAVLTIELNGAGAGASANGLLISASDTTVRGLVINRFALAGIELSGAGATNDNIAGNFIGTTAVGTAARGDGTGVLLDSGASGNVVGGTSPAARNLISGNTANGISVATAATANSIQGNYIGTDATGTVALPNRNGILIDATNTMVGGPGAGNLISGNTFSGVLAGESGAVIQGNAIGVDVTGTRSLENSTGITVGSGTSALIGGTAPGSRNLISGNPNFGVFLNGASRTTVQGNYIGTDLTGTVALFNGTGVSLIGGTGNLIGGTAPGAGNVIVARDGHASVDLSNGSTGNLIQGNKLGTDATGTHILGNLYGVFATTNSGDNVIGGTEAGAGNLISGSRVAGIGLFNGSGGTRIQGNQIGTDITGTVALANDTGLIIGGGSNLIGGTDPGAGNLISGNTTTGLNLGAIFNLVEGNRIGTDAAGTHALANGIGILAGTANQIIGGTEPGAGNLISGNTGAGIQVNNSGFNIVVQGNLIGTDVTGTRALGNGTGVEIPFGPNNLIGGTAPETRNVISGNRGAGVLIGSSGNKVQGNYIGTDVTGTLALGNQNGVTITANDNTVGGSDASAGNLISGNRVFGVSIAADGNVVEANLIGTDVTGTVALGNSSGVTVSGSNNIVGGPGAGNLMSGNQADAISIFSGTGNRVEANFIGTDVTGTLALGNIRGLFVRGSGTRIVGNVISGNRSNGLELDLPGGSDNVVQGNLIGTDASGSFAVANNGVGIGIQTSGNLIGGTAPGQGNVISGNVFGITIFLGSGNTIQGNDIGTDATGTSAVPNTFGIVVSAGANTIGGTAPGAGNLISGNIQTGLLLGSSGNLVQGNLIGTEVTGTFALGNNLGVAVSSANNTIGGTTTGARNVVSGNRSAGILVVSSGTIIQGNYIGTDRTGTSAVPNAIGVSVSSSNNTIGGTTAGAGNVIAFNDGDGVRIDTGIGNAIVRNSIFANAGLGIELVNHGNNDQVAPVLTSAVSGGGFTTIQGTFTGRPSTTYLIEFFADAGTPAQGQRFLAALVVTTDVTGHANFDFTIGLELDPGLGVTATATDPANNTSAFSAAVGVTS